MVSNCKRHLEEARHRTPVLIVARMSSVVTQLRHVLLQIGFSEVRSASSYILALKSLQEDPAPIILFDDETPEGSEISNLQFVELAQKAIAHPVLIAVSGEPSGDTLFSLLKAGTVGFLIPPFTAAAIEDVFTQVIEGVHLSETILKSEDRHEAFAELIRESLDMLGRYRQAHPDDSDGVGERIKGFKEVVKTAKFFCESTNETLAEELFRQCIEYAEILDAKASSSRLKKARERLKKERQQRVTKED